jgi:hypothetical protein
MRKSGTFVQAHDPASIRLLPPELPISPTSANRSEPNERRIVLSSRVFTRPSSTSAKSRSSSLVKNRELSNRTRCVNLQAIGDRR